MSIEKPSRPSAEGIEKANETTVDNEIIDEQKYENDVKKLEEELILKIQQIKNLADQGIPVFYSYSNSMTVGSDGANINEMIIRPDGIMEKKHIFGGNKALGMKMSKEESDEEIKLPNQYISIFSKDDDFHGNKHLKLKVEVYENQKVTNGVYANWSNVSENYEDWEDEKIAYDNYTDKQYEL